MSVNHNHITENPMSYFSTTCSSNIKNRCRTFFIEYFFAKFIYNNNKLKKYLHIHHLNVDIDREIL